LKKNNGGNGFAVGDNVRRKPFFPSSSFSCSFQVKRRTHFLLSTLLQISLADFALFNFFSTVDLNGFPVLAGLVERIGARPKIAHWVKTRPVTPF
jgi:hypothetical protein